MVLSATGVVGTVVAISSERGNRWLTDVVRSRAQGAMTAGRFSLDAIRTDLRRTVSVHGLRVEDGGGRSLLYVESAALDWDPVGLLDGTVRVGAVDVHGLELDIRLEGDGNVDLLRVFGAEAPSPDDPVQPFAGVGVDLSVGVASLHDARLTLRGPDDVEVVAMTGTLSTPLEIHGRDVRLHGLELTSALDAPFALPVTGTGDVGLVSGTLELGGLTLDTGRSRVRLDGVVARAETAPAFGLEVEAVPLAAADVAIFAGRPVLRRDLGVSAAVRGTPDALRIALEADSGTPGLLAVSSTLGLAGSPPFWTVDAQTDGLDLGSTLADLSEPLMLSGRYRVGAVGVDWPNGLDAVVGVEGGAVSFQGERLTGLGAVGHLSGGRLRLEALRGEHFVGRAAGDGEVDLVGGTARLSVRASVPRLERLERLGAPAMVGRAGFAGPVTVDWSGPEVKVDGSGSLDASRVVVEDVALASVGGPFRFAVRGDAVDGEGDLTATGLVVGDLAVSSARVAGSGSWAPSAGASGRALVDASGLDIGDGALRIQGMVGALEGVAPAVGAPRLTGGAYVADLLMGPGKVPAEGGPVDLLLERGTVSVGFDLGRGSRPLLAGRVTGDLVKQEWVAEELVVAPLLDRALEADGPTRFRLADGGVRDLELVLRSDTAKVSATGDLVPRGAGASSLSLEVQGLDLAEVAQIHDLYAVKPGAAGLTGLEGVVDAAGSLQGEADWWTELDVSVAGLTVPASAGVEVVDLDADLTLTGAAGGPELSVRLHEDQELLLDLRGTVPVAWADEGPGPDCGAPARFEAVLPPGEWSRLSGHLPMLPTLDAMASASIHARGPLCDPEVSLVSTWSVPVGPSGERVRVELDADRRGSLLELRSVVEEGLARRLTLSGTATTPASDTLALLLRGEGGDTVTRPDAWVDSLDLELVPHGVPVARLAELAGLGAAVQGRVEGRVKVGGPLGHPVVDGALRVEDGMIGAVPVSEARLGLTPSTDAGYSLDGRVGFGRNSALGDVSVAGEVPVQLDLDRDLESMLGARGLSVRLDGAGVPLSVLEGLSGDIEEAAGRATIGGVVTGSLLEPVPNFVVGVREGLLVHRGLGVRFSDIELDLRANAHRVELARFRLETAQRDARTSSGRLLGAAQPGTLEVTGDAGLGRQGIEDIELDVVASRLWLSNRPDARFRVDGNLSVLGRWPDVSVGGTVEMLEGTLSLDERVFMDSGDLALDPDITVLRQRGVGRGVAADVSSVFDALDLDVNLDLHRGLRLRAAVPMDDSMGREVTALSTVRLDAELASPALRVQTRDGDLVVHGQVELPKGQMTLMGSKFVLASDSDNSLSFISDDYLEPSLDLTAHKSTRSYGTVEARVTGSPSAPSISFENPDYPDETDIMSILLFGKPASALADSEGQAGAGMLSAALGMMARSSLTQALGSGVMRTEVEVDSESFRVGRPINDRVFASFEYLTQQEDDEGTFEVTLEWLITRYLYAEVAGGDGGNSADLFWRWRF